MSSNRSSSFWRWLGAAVLLYAVFMVLTVPAATIVRRLQPHGIAMADVTGTVWNGHASAVQAKGITFGPTRWRIRPLSLLLGRLTVELNARRDDGYVDAVVAARLSGRVRVTDLRAALPIATFNSLGIAGNWQGSLQAQIPELVIDKGWPTVAQGSVEAHDLVGPARQPAAIGSYRVEFERNASPENANELRGQLTSLQDAPLDVTGVLRLLPNRQYVIDAQVATRTNAPASINRALQYLGAPDARGRRSLSIAGSF